MAIENADARQKIQLHVFNITVRRGVMSGKLWTQNNF
jgi:hypothetical protein